MKKGKKMSSEIVEVSGSKEERAFNFLQRKAKAFISGSILPQRFRNTGDVIVLDEMSASLNIPMIMLAQGLYIVKGTPSMSGQMVIAILNGSGRFDEPIQWEEQTNPWGVRAFALLKGKKLYGEWITDDLIKANGWASNPHWKNNKGLMARYRSASWFGRLYAPDLLMAFKTEGEVQDIEAIEAEEVQSHDDLNAAISNKPQQPVTPEPKPEPTKTPVKRVPRFVSKMYYTLEQYGVKKHDLKKFAEYMDLEGMGEDGVKEFFAQTPAEVKGYVNNFYGIETDAVEAEIEEQDEAEAVFGTAETPNEPSPEPMEAKTPETSTQKPMAGIKLARYRGGLIKHGLKPEDCDAFIDWAQLNDENIDEFVKDPGGVDDLIGQFNTEMGYA